MLSLFGLVNMSAFWRSSRLFALLLGCAATTGVVATSYTDDPYYCDVHMYCQRSIGFWSFCKTWQDRPSCAFSRLSCANVCPGVAGPVAPATNSPVVPVQLNTTVAPTTLAPSSTILVSKTTPVPTTAGILPVTVTATTAMPVQSTLPQPLDLSGGGCAKSVTKTVSDFFIWTEWPSLSDLSAASAYYDGLLKFIRSNCAGLGVTRVVLRILHPYYPWKDQNFYLPSQTSVLYQAFISKLPSNVELVMYGYVMEAPAIQAWTTELGVSTAIEGVVAFMKKWNDFLGSVGSSQRFKGVVFDLEEFPSMQKLSPWTLNAGNVAALKSKYGQFEFSTTIGYDALGTLSTQAAFVDKLYLQLYDLYQPYRNVGPTADSRFLVFKNNAATMGDFILNTVLSSQILSAYAQYSDKVMLMWSNQNLVGSCLYPLDGKTNCGANNEFGLWDPDAYNAFLSYVKGKSPVLNNLKHGLFQYSFTPPSWVSK